MKYALPRLNEMSDGPIACEPSGAASDPILVTTRFLW